MNFAKLFFVASATASLAGCGASLPSLTTGSLFGGKPASPVVQNDPISRAMEVGATSARAIKCGYNFDPAKLKSQFLAAETAANPADAGKLTQVYDTTFNGIAKAVAAKADYCNEAKTNRIKQALNRHLAGDYTPSPPEPAEQDDGLFSGFGSGGSNEDGSPNTKQVFE